MHTDMTAVTIQSNKIVLNEVKDDYALLEPSYRKNLANFLTTTIKKLFCFKGHHQESGGGVE